MPRAKTDFRVDAARADARSAWLERRPDMTAVFCDDDVLAAGLYVAARELGVRIPDDLAVVGFGDFDIGRVLDPAAHDDRRRRRGAGEDGLRACSASRWAGGKPADRVLPVSAGGPGFDGRRRLTSPTAGIRGGGSA